MENTTNINIFPTKKKHADLAVPLSNQKDAPHRSETINAHGIKAGVSDSTGP